MIFSLCNEVISDRPFEEQCAFAVALRYDSLEIAPFTLGDDPMKLADKDVSRTLRAMDAEGIVATGLRWQVTDQAGSTSMNHR